ncbi:unnamed protein product, partial [Leptidea sinapis]
ISPNMKLHSYEAEAGPDSLVVNAHNNEIINTSLIQTLFKLQTNPTLLGKVRTSTMDSSYQGGVAHEEADEFQRLSQTIASNIKKISHNVSSMSKMVNQLQTPQDSQELRKQLRQIQNYTQKMAKDTSSMIMEIMKMKTDKATNRLTRERLSDEYIATLNAFQSTQRIAAQKTKEDVKKVKAQNIGIDAFASGSQKDLVEMGAARKQEQMTLQSERELNDIMDVNQIFKELGAMIHDQGTIVDSIESNVEYTSQNIESGNKMRKKKVYLTLIVLIIISIIIIAIFYH